MHFIDALLDRSISNVLVLTHINVTHITHNNVVDRKIWKFLRDRRDKIFSRTKVVFRPFGLLIIFVHCSLYNIWLAFAEKLLTLATTGLFVCASEIEFRVLTATKFERNETIGCEHSGSAMCRLSEHSQSASTGC